MGVDLFFVLSGFLISGILLDTKETPNYFKNFYARRVLRIWPLYYCLLALMFVVLPRVSAAQGVAIFAKSSPWWAYPLFMQNFLLPLSTDAAGPLGVTWSLAIEEQFYLVWPIIVRFLSRRQVAILAIAEIAASPVLRYFLAAHHIHIYANFFCRLDGLMLGAFLAALVRSKDFVRERYIGLALAVLAVAAPLAVIMDLRQAEWIVFTFTSLAAGAIVYLAIFWQQKWFQWHAGEPVFAVYGDDQLRIVFTAQDCVRGRGWASCELCEAPAGDAGRDFDRELCAGDYVVECA